LETFLFSPNYNNASSFLLFNSCLKYFYALVGSFCIPQKLEVLGLIFSTSFLKLVMSALIQRSTAGTNRALKPDIKTFQSATPRVCRTGSGEGGWKVI
jgi:hypothetical protein